ENLRTAAHERGLLRLRSVGVSSAKLDTFMPCGARQARRSPMWPPTVSVVCRLAINSLQLPLCDLDCALEILPTSAKVRKHIDQHKIGQGGCRLLTDGAQAANCE